MTRRTLTPDDKRRIAESRHWRAPEGEPLCLENGEVVFLGTGKRPEWDHIHPLAIGGSNDDDNFQPMSPEAHAVKSRQDSQVRRMIRHVTGANKERPKRRWPKRPFGIPGRRKKLTGEVVKV
ncbi:MAG: hypothetical protein V3S55_06185 [Nitrospiraceae bacterium]